MECAIDRLSNSQSSDPGFRYPFGRKICLRGMTYSALTLPVLIGFLALTAFASTVQDDQTTRRLWDTDYLKPKPKPTAGKPAPPKRRYRPVTPQISAQKVAGDTVLGITIWRLRPSKVADDTEVRILKHQKDESKIESWTPERIPADTPLATGQRVRLSIE